MGGYIKKNYLKIFMVLLVMGALLLGYRGYEEGARYKGKLGIMNMKQLELIYFHTKFLQEDIMKDNISEDKWEADMMSIKNYRYTGESPLLFSLFEGKNFFKKYGDYGRITTEESLMEELKEDIKEINKNLDGAIKGAYEYEEKYKRWSLFKEHSGRFLYDYINGFKIDKHR